MIKVEILENNLIRHYSDKGFYILQNETNIKYSEAVDIIPCRYTYSETTEPIEVVTEENNE